MAREPALACEADGNYHICEYYLSALSPVLPDALFLGSAEALRTPARLTRHRISHVLLLCSDPQSAARSPSATLSGVFGSLTDLDRRKSAVGPPMHSRASQTGTGVILSPNTIQRSRTIIALQDCRCSTWPHADCPIHCCVQIRDT